MFTVNVTTCTTMLQMTGREAKMEYTTEPLLLTKHPSVMNATTYFLTNSHSSISCSLSSNTAGLHTGTVPVRLYGNSRILKSFTAILHPQEPVHSHTHTHTHTKVMKQPNGNSCIIQSIYTKSYRVIRMRVHKNYISYNFSNSALPPTTVWKKHILKRSHTVDITASKYKYFMGCLLFSSAFTSTIYSND